jgi:hypothetical protein
MKKPILFLLDRMPWEDAKFRTVRLLFPGMDHGKAVAFDADVMEQDHQETLHEIANAIQCEIRKDC